MTVITVDDSQIIANRIKSLLSEMQDVRVVGNAGTIMAALDLIEVEVPDVVILDIQLKADAPANGIHLLAILRDRFPQMKIIMLTNMTAPQYRTTCIELGANYFLDKSNDFEKINQAMSEIAKINQPL